MAARRRDLPPMARLSAASCSSANPCRCAPPELAPEFVWHPTVRRGLLQAQAVPCAEIMHGILGHVTGPACFGRCTEIVHRAQVMRLCPRTFSLPLTSSLMSWFYHVTTGLWFLHAETFCCVTG